MSAPPLPAGFRVRLDPRVHRCDGGATLQHQGRVLRLSATAQRLVSSEPVEVSDRTSARLARLLLDRGFAHPVVPEPAVPDAEVAGVTVVVPVHDRPDVLDRLLAALPGGVPAVVVDDASPDAVGIAAVAERYGAHLVRHLRNRGPAAARNTGLAACGTPLVVFCDADVVPEPGWLGTLAAHLADPAVVMVAPRVLGPPAAAADGAVTRYEQARSSLDLGPEPAPVRPRTPVAYVPSACLLVRREAVGGFDEEMRCGEDVDLVWRLVRAGHVVRYEPRAVVRHHHRDALGPWLARKAFYGTSAAPLAVRHGPAVAPVVVTPWAVAFVAALAAQRRWSVPLATAVLAGTTGVVATRLPEQTRRVAGAATMVAEGAVASLWQAAAVLLRHHWPLAAAGALVSVRVRRLVLVAAVTEAALDHRQHPGRLDPLRYGVLHRLDDLAYGTGLWLGCWRARSVRALLPARPTPR